MSILLRSTDGSLTINADGSAAVAGQTFAQLPTAAALSLTDGIAVHQAAQSSPDGATTLTSVRDLILANDGSVDEMTLTPLTSTQAASASYRAILNGSAAVVPFSALVAAVSAAIGSGGTSATSPGQVGSLTAGTPTSTTIPLTWTAATGTAPITYTVRVSVHGANSYSTAAGTFGATGGTITGLTAGTSYDIQVVATNTAGSSTTVLTNVADASAGGGSGTAPANHVVLTQTSPVYSARNDGSGRQMMTGGSGSAPITLPSNGQWLIKLGVRGGTNYMFNANPYIKVASTDGSSFVGAALNNRSISPGDNAGGNGDPAPASITDGQIHELALEAHSGGGSTGYQDGSVTAVRDSNIAQSGASVFSIQADINPNALAGTFDIRIYDGTMRAPGNLLYEWLLDGSGAAV